MAQEFHAELFDAMSVAVSSIQDYLFPYQKTERSKRVGLRLLGVIFSVIETEELLYEDSAAALWAEIETGTKEGGLTGIATKLENPNRGNSIADMADDDVGER